MVSGVGPELLKGALRHKKTPHLCVGELCLLILGIHLALSSPEGLAAVRVGSVPWGGSQRDLEVLEDPRVAVRGLLSW